MRTSNRTARTRAVGVTRGGTASGLARSSHFGKASVCGDDPAGDSDLQLRESWPELRVSPVPLITAGVSDVDLNGQVRTACRVAVRGLGIALRLRDPPHVVVLGEEALRFLRPSVIGPLLRRPGCVSLACVRACPAHVIADWARRCPIEFVPEGCGA